MERADTETNTSDHVQQCSDEEEVENGERKYLLRQVICSLNLIYLLPRDDVLVSTEHEAVNRGGSHIKGTVMLAVSLRSANHGFWSHLGRQNETPIFLAVKVSFRISHEEIENAVISFRLSNVEVY